jgi:subtilisin family serine protease
MWQLSCSEAADDGPVFNDPRYGDNSWAFRLINVESVWRQGITGSGVHIRINDEGLDSSVVDLAGKFDLEGSCESYLPSSSEDMHGTACASIAAAAANNGECTVGIAPGATISSCKVYGRGIEDGLQHPDFLLYTLDRQDVSSNSFGIQSCVSNNNEEASDLTRHGRPEREIQQSSTASSQCPFLPGPDYPPCSACGGAVLGVGANEDPLDAACVASIVAYCSDFFAYEADADACVQHLELFATCHYNALAPSYQTVLTKAIREGRNGKGLIVVFAAGNEYGVGGDANMDGILSSRLTISVGAVGKNGRHALYSTPGSCLFVSAPGGDVESQTNWVVAKPGGGCTDVTSTGASLQGTSLAAPVVAGVVALMLEVNPLLTWRDVQGILARTSQRVYDPNGSADSLATTNAAGYWHSYLYGFGIVDAAAAVRAASNWTNFGQERMVSGSSGQVNLTIDDSGTVVNSTVLIRTGGRTMTVESVVVYLDVETSSRGHLEIRLYSPAGTESILAPGMRPTSAQVPKSSRWKLMTVRNWGESTRGLWTLSVADTKPGDYSSSNRTSGCVDNAYDDDDYYYYLVQDCAALEKNVGLKACDEMPKARLACCFCGGGQAVVATRDHLESWTIVVYGRDGSASASDEEAFPPIANPESSASSPIPSALRSPAPTFRQRSNADPPSFTLTVDSPLPEVRLPPKGQDGDGASTSIVSDGDDDSRSTPSSSATTRYSNWFLRRRGARRLSNLLLMTC